MLIGNILHACSNDRVAEAAVASIGGEFSARVHGLARRCDLPVGTLTGHLVRRFAVHAAERDWRHVSAVIEGDDLPVLRGLQAIVDSVLRSPGTSIYLANLASEAGDLLPVWTVSPDMRIGAVETA